MKSVQVSRRDFLKVSGMAGAGLALASCTAVVPETGTEAAAQEVTVFFWDGPPLIGIREEALAPFDEAYPGCELNFTSVPGGWNAGYSEKLYAGLAANDPPDLFIIRIADLPEFLSKDLLLDLKPYVDRDLIDQTGMEVERLDPQKALFRRLSSEPLFQEPFVHSFRQLPEFLVKVGIEHSRLVVISLAGKKRYWDRFLQHSDQVQ